MQKVKTKKNPEQHNKIPDEALFHLEMPKSKHKVPINHKFEHLMINGTQSYLNKRTGEILASVPLESGSIGETYWIKDKQEGYILCELVESTPEATKFKQIDKQENEIQIPTHEL